MTDQEELYIGMTRYKPPVFSVELYPAGGIMAIDIGLEHVRAADAIRVSYDFERDGYVIQQSRYTDDDQTGDLWQEVAFIPAWQLDERKDGE